MPESAIIIPSYGRPDALRQCLTALAALTEPDYTVIVVDDGSPVPLEPICASFEGVRCLRQENAGPASARNRGAAAADARFLAFTDDDCRPRPTWLTNLRQTHGGEDRRLVGGHVVNGLPDNPYATASQDLTDFLYEWFDAAGGDAPFFTSNNMGCSAQRFREFGGFDESFPLAAGEDRDFGLRWRDADGVLTYAPSAIVDHYHAMTLRRYWRQHRNYGRGAKYLHHVLAARGSDHPRREPLGFYAALLTRPLRRHGLAGLQGGALAFLSQLAMVAGYSSRDPR